MSKIILFIEKYFAFALLHLLRLTYRYKVSGLAKPYPHAIYVFWHRYIVPMVINRRGENAVIIISSSRDGDYIAEPAKLLGYKVARGSSTRGGKNALKQMVSLSSKHSFGITPDGPKGPSFVVKEGVLVLAYLTGLPIYAIRVSVSRAYIFKSWDGFVLPLPFAKICVEYSEAIWVRSKEVFAGVKEEMEMFMGG